MLLSQLTALIGMALYFAGSVYLAARVFNRFVSLQDIVDPDKQMLDVALRQLSIRIVSLDLEVAYHAGKKWQQYRKTGGKRNRVLADFLIGAHADMRSEKLLTRDRGFYKKYFKNLKIL